MIICVFNHYFPHKSGFGHRCWREIEALCQIDAVTVVCRHADGEKLSEIITAHGREVQIVRYRASSEVVHRPEGYRGTGWYEIKRNLDLLWGMISTLVKVMRQSSKPVDLYAVTSPLTVPLLGLLLAPLFGVRRQLVSFHDLEPELAMHLKKIPRHHWLVWLELKLEWLVCRSYRKILVTTTAQAEILSRRTKTALNKYCVIENVRDLKTELKKNRSHSKTSRSSFVIAYMSTISFDYTIEGLKEFLTTIKPLLLTNKNILVQVIGSGEGLASLTEFIEKNDLIHSVSCVGQVDQPTAYLAQAQLAIIPWKKDIMTETMLPTKLFEYLSLGLPVLAPNFGEFSRTLKSGSNAMLYADSTELLAKLTQLIENPRLRTKIGEGGSALFESTYHPDLLAKKLIAYYQT